MGLSRRQAGYAGSGAVTFWAIVQFVLALPSNIDRWREVVGTVNLEGLSWLALLAGLMLLAPLAVEGAGSRIRRFSTACHERRERRRHARRVLPHLESGLQRSLRILLSEDSELEDVPDVFANPVYHKGSYRTVWGLDPDLRRTVRKFLKAQDKESDRNRREKIKSVISSLDRNDRKVLWAFSRHILPESRPFLQKEPFVSSIRKLGAEGILRVYWGQYHSIPIEISLSTDAVSLIQEMVLGGQRIEVSSIRIGRSR